MNTAPQAIVFVDLQVKWLAHRIKMEKFNIFSGMVVCGAVLDFYLRNTSALVSSDNLNDRNPWEKSFKQFVCLFREFLPIIFLNNYLKYRINIYKEQALD